MTFQHEGNQRIALNLVLKLILEFLRILYQSKNTFFDYTNILIIPAINVDSVMEYNGCLSKGLSCKNHRFNIKNKND